MVCEYTGVSWYIIQYQIYWQMRTEWKRESHFIFNKKNSYHSKFNKNEKCCEEKSRDWPVACRGCVLSRKSLRERARAREKERASKTERERASQLQWSKRRPYMRPQSLDLAATLLITNQHFFLSFFPYSSRNLDDGLDGRTRRLRQSEPKIIQSESTVLFSFRSVLREAKTRLSLK